MQLEETSSSIPASSVSFAQVPSARQYGDYREFLRDYYRFMKNSESGFSHRVFVRRLGKKSPSFLADVIESRVNLGLESVRRFTKILGLGDDDGAYFEALVFFQQAKITERHLGRLDEWVQRLLRLQQTRADGKLPFGISEAEYISLLNGQPNPEGREGQVLLEKMEPKMRRILAMRCLEAQFKNAMKALENPSNAPWGA